MSVESVISLDANALIYSADIDAGSRYVTAKEIMVAANRGNTALTEQSLFEFFHASTRKGKMSTQDATSVTRELARNFSLLLPYPTVIEDTFALIGRHHLSIWDARVLAVCAAHGCDHLLSEDLQDGAQYGGVTVVNPFNAANASLIGQLLS
jgi:predicted nucleic acid-binding protein